MGSFKTLERNFENFIFITLCLLNGSFDFMKFQSVTGQIDNSHNISKRMDLESCLGQFDIHRNMIIRTAESQAIGGKYLQGIALETVEECRRLCCETESCDVFVFEEKSEEYCYLFECGHPENFRCKFTKHGNFTSAVLTPIRYITGPPTVQPPRPPPPPPPQIVPSKQEMELTSLKQKLDSTVKTKSSPPPAVQVTTTAKTSLGTVSNCGRFQFQCHSGECIGIYNACNGIPQCEDGSDEGPECSGNPATNTKTIVGGITGISANSPTIIDDRTAHKSPVIQTIPRPYQPQIIQMPSINNREDSMSGGVIWPSRKIADGQTDLESNSRIFNHKAGLQIPANNMAQFPNQNPNVIYNSLPNQRGIYVQQDLQNPYRSAIIQPQDHIMLPLNVNWPVQETPQSLMPGLQYNTVNEQLAPSAIKITHETVDTPAVQISSGKAQDSNPNNVGESTNNLESTIKTNKKNMEKDKDNSKDSEEYVDYTETSTEAPKKKTRKHKKVQKESKKDENKVNDPVEKAINTPYNEQYKMIKNNLEMEFVDHDGYSEKPGGAVLSLTLGVLVTAALAILVGCRMRLGGRRVRRLGKAPYGNDADFLVNGMYL